MSTLVSRLVQANAFGDHQYTEHFDVRELARGYADSLSGAEIVEAEGAVFVVRRSVWDSEFWGINVWRIEEWLAPDGTANHEAALRSLERLLRGWAAHVVFLRLSATATARNQAVARHGLWFCGSKVMMSRPLSTAPVTPSDRDGTVVPFSDRHRDELAQWAVSTFQNSRFNNDPHFPADVVREMYARWLENMLETRPGGTWIFEVGGRPVGFVGIHTERPFGLTALPPVSLVELVATDPEYRAKGVATSLVDHAVTVAASRGSARLYANTMLTNHRAQALFGRCQLQIFHALHEWHWWLGKPPISPGRAYA